MSRKSGQGNADFDPSIIGANTYVCLKTAARLAFPDGSIGISCLRGEAKRGRLVVWRVGNKDMTTLTEVAKMVDLSRVQPNPLDSGSARPRTISLNNIPFEVSSRLRPELTQTTGEIFAQRILSRRGRGRPAREAKLEKLADAISSVPDRDFQCAAASYRVKHVAKLIGISVSSVYGMISRGQLRTAKLGTITVIRHEELLALLERGNDGRKATDEAPRTPHDRRSREGR